MNNYKKIISEKLNCRNVYYQNKNEKVDKFLDNLVEDSIKKMQEKERENPIFTFELLQELYPNATPEEIEEKLRLVRGQNYKTIITSKIKTAQEDDYNERPDDYNVFEENEIAKDLETEGNLEFEDDDYENIILIENNKEYSVYYKYFIDSSDRRNDILEILNIIDLTNKKELNEYDVEEIFGSYSYVKQQIFDILEFENAGNDVDEKAYGPMNNE